MIGSSVRYGFILVQNFRSSLLIENLGGETRKKDPTKGALYSDYRTLL